MSRDTLQKWAVFCTDKKQHNGWDFWGFVTNDEWVSDKLILEKNGKDYFRTLVNIPVKNGKRKRAATA